jgi:hypothetical protein
MVAIVPPAAASFFPGMMLRLNGYLSSLGVEAFFDVALGAELTAASYEQYIDENSPRLVIAQPCPALVTYIELYRPELLPYLAPTHSPMLHTVEMIRAFFPEYADARIVAVSPCIAKKREFAETDPDILNVTLSSLEASLKAGNLDLADFPEVGFFGGEAERAVLFSSPGGLKATVLRDLPELEPKIRKIEGPAIYPYLKELPESLARGHGPLIVDCLNCEKGCNGGTGTGRGSLPIDMLEAPVLARRSAQISGGPRSASAAAKSIRKTVGRYWRKGLYHRKYVDRSSRAALKSPTEKELQEIYGRLGKSSAADLVDCGACGYENCRTMAVAILNGRNKPENCHFFRAMRISLIGEKIAGLSVSLGEDVQRSLGTATELSNQLETLHGCSAKQRVALRESASAIEEMLASLSSSSSIARSRCDALGSLAGTASSGSQALAKSLSAISSIQERAKGIESLTSVIGDVSERTNLLAMNASIEAAHAGQAGKGFAVVANEVRKLAGMTAKSSGEIGSTLKNLTGSVDEAVALAKESSSRIGKIFGNLEDTSRGLEEIFGNLSEISAGSQQINGALESLSSISVTVDEALAAIEKTLKVMVDEIDELSRESTSKIKELGAQAKIAG